jgi:hypothetical protein
MLKIAIALALSLAAAPGADAARSRTHTTYFHRARSGGSAAAAARKECKARCKSDYEINASMCSASPRGHKSECRHLESWTRQDCLAHCV